MKAAMVQKLKEAREQISFATCYADWHKLVPSNDRDNHQLKANGSTLNDPKIIRMLNR